VFRLTIPTILLMALLPLFVSCGHGVNSPKRPGANEVSTNLWPDLTERLPRASLDAFAKAIGADTGASPATVREKVLSNFDHFRTQADVERGYWTLLTYKYWRQVSDPSNFQRAWGNLDASGAPRILNRLAHDQAERLGERSLSDAFGMLAGLSQFGLDGESSDRNEEIRDRLYWRSERRALRALLATNQVERWLLAPLADARRKAYQIPVTNLSALYLYERGGVSWDYFKYKRLEALTRLKSEFPRSDWWIFTNTHFPDLSYRR
jgi:hypothetical protein